MFDRDIERRNRKIRRLRDKAIKDHKSANAGRKPKKSDLRLLRRYYEDVA